MGSTAISLIVFAFVLGGALFGIFLRSVLPQHHLSPESRDIVRLGMGLVATMSALVLGLLVSSAKSSYDAQSNELTEVSAKVVMLDRVLARYGPESNEARSQLRIFLVRAIDRIWPQERAQTSEAEPPSTGPETLFDEIQALSPKDEKQRWLQTQALNIATTLGQTRWLMYEQRTTSVSKPLLVVLVFWITMIFLSFGLFAPRNTTVVAALSVSALSVSGAIFLILEMYTPYSGVIRISSASLRFALAHIGQ